MGVNPYNAEVNAVSVGFFCCVVLRFDIQVFALSPGIASNPPVLLSVRTSVRR